MDTSQPDSPPRPRLAAISTCRPLRTSRRAEPQLQRFVGTSADVATLEPHEAFVPSLDKSESAYLILVGIVAFALMALSGCAFYLAVHVDTVGSLKPTFVSA